MHSILDLSNLWRDRFDHVYCISFAPYKDRREKLLEEVRRVHIVDYVTDDFTHPFFTVHYTVENPFEQLLMSHPNFRYPKHNMRFNKGALSLAIGNYCVMKEALSLGYKRILIIEDDIAFLKDFTSIIELFEGGIPDTDIIMYDKVVPNKTAWEHDMKNGVFCNGKYVKLSPQDIVWTTSCYSVNEKAMHHIIRCQETSMNVADYYTNAFLPTENYSMILGNTGISRSASILGLACQRPSRETISDHGNTNSVYNQNGLYDCGINLGEYNI